MKKTIILFWLLSLAVTISAQNIVVKKAIVTESFKLQNVVNNISKSSALSENSDLVLPTQKAVKSYVDANGNATHTGDATGATALTLATVNATPGTYGGNSVIPVITVNNKGLVTFSAAQSINIASNSTSGILFSGDWNTFNNKVTNATHTGDATGATALTLATVNSNVGTFGSANVVPQITVNAKGLITGVTNINPQFASASTTGIITNTNFNNWESKAASRVTDVCLNTFIETPHTFATNGATKNVLVSLQELGGVNCSTTAVNETIFIISKSTTYTVTLPNVSLFACGATFVVENASGYAISDWPTSPAAYYQVTKNTAGVLLFNRSVKDIGLVFTRTNVASFTSSATIIFNNAADLNTNNGTKVIQIIGL